MNAGGGAYYGAFAACSLGEKTVVLTKVAKKDRWLFEDLESFGVEVVFLDTENSTSIENFYPTSNPDDRKSRLVSRADPFQESDLQLVKEEKVHVTPLWYGEFPENLVPKLREKVSILSGDAQGFLRHVEKGEMVYRDWEKKKEYLPMFDVFKVDIKEAEVLTGEKEPESAIKKLGFMGGGEILMTMSNGIFLYREGRIFFAPFGEWKMEGRTGRGDTAAAAYLVLRDRIENPQDLVKRVAEITTKKMQRPGPYRGW